MPLGPTAASAHHTRLPLRPPPYTSEGKDLLEKTATPQSTAVQSSSPALLLLKEEGTTGKAICYYYSAAMLLPPGQAVDQVGDSISQAGQSDKFFPKTSWHQPFISSLTLCSCSPEARRKGTRSVPGSNC